MGTHAHTQIDTKEMETNTKVAVSCSNSEDPHRTYH